MKKTVLITFLLLRCILAADDTILQWAADTESGAPNAFYQDGNMSNFVGFEKDIVERVAALIGRRPVFCQNDFDVLIPGLQRGLYDVVVNGIISNERMKNSVLRSIPYYACGLALVVREDEARIKSVLDCNGATVGILKNAGVGPMLTSNLKSVKVIMYPNEYFALLDLKGGRIDAVVVDWQIAAYYAEQIGNLKIIDEFRESRYSFVLRLGNDDLLQQINSAIETMKADGSLDAIINKWGVRNRNYEQMLKETSTTVPRSAKTIDPAAKKTKSYGDYINVMPLFIRAACVSLLLSICAMCVAIIVGLGLAIVRLYMPKWMNYAAVSIIELLRGTPLLIQLFFVFYGLPCVGITLPPLVAGILTLGLNYSAYEAENIRAGMLAVPYGQMEAARALGMSQWQSLKYVILPQAFAFILPPLTNDFIALIKDTSLVSLITIIELAKAYTLSASNSMDFFGTGIIVAMIYFLIGLPFVRIARWAEKHLRREKRAYSSRRI
jgi:polar amino acid transport system substrate-binding protein